MAKKGVINNNNLRRKLVKSHAARRSSLKAIISDKNVEPDVRFAAVLKLASLPRNSSSIRIRNRCELTGRPRGYYRKFKLSRNMLRELASVGQLPGIIKSSW